MWLHNVVVYKWKIPGLIPAGNTNPCADSSGRTSGVRLYQIKTMVTLCDKLAAESSISFKHKPLWALTFVWMLLLHVSIHPCHLRPKGMTLQTTLTQTALHCNTVHKGSSVIPVPHTTASFHRSHGCQGHVFTYFSYVTLSKTYG